MLIKINNVITNVLYIVSIKEKLKTCSLEYTLSNGEVLLESFNSKEDLLLKLEEIKKAADDAKRWEVGTGLYSAQTVGTLCSAKGECSVAEGEMSVAGVSDAVEDWREGKGAHAEGGGTTAAGNYSHAEGNSTVTNNPYEHAEGLFNYSHYSQPVYPSATNTIHSIGIGGNLLSRKNAFEVMQNGDIYIIGVGGYDGTNIDTAETLQAVLNK